MSVDQRKSDTASTSAQTRPDLPGTGDVDNGEFTAQVLVMVGPAAGRLVRLSEKATVGRGDDNTIQIMTPDVSRNHARIVRSDEGDGYVVEDLGSRNGVRVNGVPVQRQALAFGDKIMIGSRSILLYSRYDGLEEQIVQLQKMEALGQIAAGVAHDFNNLLASAQGNLSLLSMMAGSARLDDPEVVESLSDLGVVFRLARDLVRQLMALAERRQPREQEMDLSRVVDEAVQLAHRTFPRNIRFTTAIAPGLLVNGDPSQLHQVLLNVLINARDAMADGGTISVSVAVVPPEKLEERARPLLTPQPHVVVEVRDTGHGMDEATRARAFEPFFTSKTGGKGIGLGLSTAYTIIKSHGGHATVSSRPGQGTRLRIFLPQLPPRGRAGAAGAATQGAYATTVVNGSQLVLVVDDDVHVRKVARRLLEAMGYRVVCASDGDEAVGYFRSNRAEIDLVLMDVMMPRMSGEEALCELRRVDPEVKVVMFSGYHDPNTRRRLEEAGIGAFLQKPFDAEGLGRAVSAALFGVTPT